ncbi:MAG: hypothetical protein IJP67_05110, partial [Oscillospiraceae bacterium]|nr:hypothetical protein [Oscillospiraceae bacterium]
FKAPDSRFIDDRANALLVLGGLITDETDIELVTKVLDTTYEASPYMEKFVLEALCRLGRQDLAIKRIKARYDLMVTDSWDTLYEQFNDVTGTYNHGWTSAPLYILSKYVAGIRPVKAGWEEYEIVLSGALEDYTCTEWTPKGIITVEKSGESVKITAIDAKGTVILPNGEVHEITSAGEYNF